MGESDGQQGANNIASCIFSWLEEVNERKVARKLLLYCDCCSGQNPNETMVAMLRHAVNSLDYIQEITLKFLLTGHSYMPVDSIHSTINSFLGKKTIMAPSEWPTIIYYLM